MSVISKITSLVSSSRIMRLPTICVVDTALSNTSNNPVQNKVVTYALTHGINKRHDVSVHSGLGRKYLTLKENSNILTQSDFDQDKTIYHIQYEFSLDGNAIEIPPESILLFEGGYIDNGFISGNNTWISAPAVEIFGSNLSVSGSFGNNEAYPEWFGAKGDGETDDTAAIRRVLESFKGHTILFGAGKVYPGNDRIAVYSNTEIVIDGTIISTDKAPQNNGISFEFYDRKTATPGYSGVHDVVIRGHGCIDPLGNIIKGQATPLRIHHCKNITIRDITCKGNYYWHFIESGGTDGLLIDNVTFYSGFSDEERVYDTIQLETIDSSSTEGAIPYDGTVTRNVTIKNCKYIVQDGSPAVNTFIGGHYVDAVHNINIVDCLCYGNSNLPESRCIEFPGSANSIRISGCRFMNFTNREPIRFGLGGLAPSDYVRDVIIENCIFENSPIASVVDTDRIMFRNNVVTHKDSSWEGCENEAGRVGQTIYLRNAYNVSICCNDFSSIKYTSCIRIDSGNCTGIEISGNTAKDLSYYFLLVYRYASYEVENLLILNNKIEDYGVRPTEVPAPAVYFQNGKVSKLLISGNVFVISSDKQRLPIHCPMVNIGNVSAAIMNNAVVIKGTLSADARTVLEENIKRFRNDNNAVFTCGNTTA